MQANFVSSRAPQCSSRGRLSVLKGATITFTTNKWLVVAQYAISEASQKPCNTTLCSAEQFTNCGICIGGMSFRLFANCGYFSKRRGFTCASQQVPSSHNSCIRISYNLCIIISESHTVGSKSFATENIICIFVMADMDPVVYENWSGIAFNWIPKVFVVLPFSNIRKLMSNKLSLTIFYNIP